MDQDSAKRLEDAAWLLANEIRDGRFAKVVGNDWQPSIRELARRVPGFTDEDYLGAITKAMFDSLW